MQTDAGSLISSVYRWFKSSLPHNAILTMFCSGIKKFKNPYYGMTVKQACEPSYLGCTPGVALAMSPAIAAEEGVFNSSIKYTRIYPNISKYLLTHSLLGSNPCFFLTSRPAKYMRDRDERRCRSSRIPSVRRESTPVETGRFMPQGR